MKIALSTLRKWSSGRVGHVFQIDGETVMAKDNRTYVFMECEETGMRLYRTQKKVKGQQTKLKLKKYNPKLRKHTMHTEKKK